MKSKGNNKYIENNNTTYKNKRKENTTKFNIISIMVNDQESALKFYTEIPEFEKKTNIIFKKS